MITFYILCKRLDLKCKGLSDERVVPLIKKKYGVVVNFLEDKLLAEIC